MSSRHDVSRLTELEEQAYAEAWQHFADDLGEFPQSYQALLRLERNLSVIAVAANMTASKSSPDENAVLDDDGTIWNKSTVLMDNIYLCHRAIPDRTEYAAMEYFPAQGRNEIWNRGWSAAEVLRIFLQEQRQAWGIWAEDIREQVKEFLMQKYPGQDMWRMADDFTCRFSQSVETQTSDRPRS
jgi:hypothetical protein